MLGDNRKEIGLARAYFVKEVKENSLFMGSRAWECFHDESDYDYLINHKKLTSILYYTN